MTFLSWNMLFLFINFGKIMVSRTGLEPVTC